MTQHDPKVIAEIVGKLSEADRDALMPFAFFSDAIGRKLKGLGLLNQAGGVWTHTPLGLAVRSSLLENGEGE